MNALTAAAINETKTIMQAFHRMRIAFIVISLMNSRVQLLAEPEIAPAFYAVRFFKCANNYKCVLLKSLSHNCINRKHFLHYACVTKNVLVENRLKNEFTKM